MITAGKGGRRGGGGGGGGGVDSVPPADSWHNMYGSCLVTDKVHRFLFGNLY